mmetsp:Transcript_12000/g.18109  ORF Transcript_12000/g.18109 Transcript_12000/m.18109 type:complete len:165 (-) Transcript_12000:216-710(-)|eukprot:CAMPEP_0116022600 /NCGR_PEP_ID=MMETSP0321-20121206/11083_1 /TAXON_ID=163516 /ORGANISM="Leptocylindrus danicus var. danicus, Strain B650" /LENGTH=164 /DNA_ID=CAMNT_0003493701 /DNA_START=107 /DNA_END=601 /DNA_ORIENTATION=-
MAADACAIGVGAVCGALSRYQIGRIATEQIARNEKLKALQGWHTAGINVAGSFALGAIAAFPGSPAASVTKTALKSQAAPQVTSTSLADSLVSKAHISPRAKLMMGIGFCGSFTTFSTYSVDIVNMMGRGETVKAVQYGLANNFGGVMAAYLGFSLIRKIFGIR